MAYAVTGNKKAKEAKTGSDVEKMLTIAMKRYQLAIEDDNERELALEDLRFASGDQWPQDIRKTRESQHRPCMTINRIQQFVKQVVNDMRQNRAGIRVSPAGSGATKELAEIYAGLIRQIETISEAPDQYISAGEGTVMIGRGYFRILAEYEEGSFDQCLRIERIQNHFSVVLDPSAKQPDKSDAKWGFITDEMPREEFEEKYPDVASEWDEGSSGDSNNRWITKDYVRIAEYYEIECIPDTMYLLTTGETVYRSELPAEPPEEVIKKKRACDRKQCVWRKITSTAELEKTVYKTTLIPIVEVVGEEYFIDGKLLKMGIVRHAKDPQRVYNYSRTAIVEQIALAPKAPFVMAGGQAEGFEHFWKNANTENFSYLPYKPVTVAGQMAPAPQRQAFAGVPAGSMADLQLASEEIKAVTGIYDAALGQKSNEVSGKAILARQREADNATYHYVDALNRAIKLCGKILIELIPIIYDGTRMILILGEDGKEDVVEINKTHPATGEMVNDMKLGKYDATISTGPSYETKRIEAVNSMTEFMHAVPDAASLMVDLIAKNMDWPGAEQISKRLATMLPPGVLESESNGEDMSPFAAAKLGEMQRVIKDLQNALQEQLGLNAELVDKSHIEDRKLDISSYDAATKRLATVLDLFDKKNEEGEAGAAGQQQNEQMIHAMVMQSLQSLMQPISTPQIEAGDPSIGMLSQMAPGMDQQQPTAPMGGSMMEQ